MLKVTKEFCGETNLHGFIYIVQPTCHKIERTFWIISIIISYLLSAILISKFIIQCQLNPIVIYTDQNIISVRDINFPAVSVCPGLILKTKQKISLDYFETRQKLENGIIEMKNMTIHELKMLQAASLVAGDSFLAENFPDLQIPTHDFLDILEEFVPFLDELKSPFARIPNFFFANWTDKYPVFMTRNFWKTGLCHTFNFPNPKEIFNAESISQHFIDRTVRILGTSYMNTSNYQLDISYPVKAHEPGKGLYMGFSEHQHNIVDILEHVVPEKTHNGLKFMFHDPFEVISDDAIIRHGRQFSYSKISIIPEVSVMDESFADFDLDKRFCYLKHEKDLKFFKVYNKVNCEHECLANRTLEQCKCIQFYMVRDHDTRICGTIDENCFRKVEDEFQESREQCKCFNPCESVKYDVHMIYDWSRKRNYERFDGQMIHSTEIMVEFGVKEVLATSRRQSQTIADILSLIGGFLGLFAGFSFLSAGEIILNFIINPLKVFKSSRSTKVHPYSISSQSEQPILSTYLTSFMESSSIHSFNHIGNEEKSNIEKTLWAVLFIISMIMSFYMIRGLYLKLKSREIVMTLEGMPTQVEDIPFPAFTIVADINSAFNTEKNYVEVDFTENSKKHYFRLKRSMQSESKITEKCEEFNDLFEHVYGTLCKIGNAVLATKYCEFNYTSTSEFVDYLRNETGNERPWFIYRNARWNGVVDPPFADMLTNYGFGYTFNLLKFNDLLYEDRISRDFQYSYDGYENTGFPWKTSAGEPNGFEITFKMNKLWSGCYDHDTFIIHPPNELPINTGIVRLEDLAATEVLVIPDIIKTDKDLATFDVNYRKCYFDDERKLKYFKIYTQKNCELECLTEIIYSDCGCVPFYSIRNSSIDVCEFGRFERCASRFEGFSLFQNYDHLYASHGLCQCYPLCNTVSYTYEVYTKSFSTNQNNSISLMWKDNEYYAQVRYQQFKIVDFLSYVGGILGLFAGISVLSIIECCYFFTLRLITDLWRFYY